MRPATRGYTKRRYDLGCPTTPTKWSESSTHKTRQMHDLAVSTLTCVLSVLKKKWVKGLLQERVLEMANELYNLSTPYMSNQQKFAKKIQTSPIKIRVSSP